MYTKYGRYIPSSVLMRILNFVAIPRSSSHNPSADLARVARSNNYMRCLAEAVLYRSIDLRNRSETRLSRCLSSVVRSTRRQAVVERLAFSYAPATSQKLINTIRLAFAAMVNLRDLEVYCAQDHPSRPSQIATQLFSGGCGFRLEKFSTDFVVDSALMVFIESQRGLRHLKLTQNPTKSASLVKHHDHFIQGMLLPNLRSVSCTVSFALSLLPKRRSIYKLEILDTVQKDHLAYVMAKIGDCRGVVPLRELSIPVEECTPEALYNIAKYVPHLHSFTLHDVRLSLTDVPYHIANLSRGLSGFDSLRFADFTFYISKMYSSGRVRCSENSFCHFMIKQCPSLGKADLTIQEHGMSPRRWSLTGSECWRKN
ncbi:hypothetical protein BOTBODRAFT_32013 [Botryobasidium botryosum FD-172 SS1]|uniref:F-box domain-containing protein n=1 Tax=Botryobasidium botryosum (strain FD-172 SS1) TaxID=930990 RepID=A0A067MTW6_BOTB1|nr:hypothetical protein BOTBODRAFT_32013 [Botryobasidium botryosum FD-172 SS1]